MGRSMGRWMAGGVSRREFGRWGALTGGAAALAGAGAGCASAAPGPPSSGSRAPLGLVLAHEQFRTDALVDFAAGAEAAGFGWVWASDHLQPWQDNQGHSMFPWLTLALVGQRTRRVSFGSGVSCPIYRYHPVEVAQAFASLGLLHPGRVFLGLGTGEPVNEQAATGRFGPYRERHDRLIEAIQIIRELWSGQRLSFRGRYFQTDQLKLYDLPPQPVPIYVAADGPRSAALAGQYGDGWICQASALTNPRVRGAFEQAARAAGKNPADMPVLAEHFVVVGGREEIDRGAELWRFTAAGSPSPNPVVIQQAAERGAPLDRVTASWTTGTDPQVHLAATQRLIDARAIPFIHPAQTNPPEAIEFYRRNIVPHLRT